MGYNPFLLLEGIKLGSIDPIYEISIIILFNSNLFIFLSGLKFLYGPSGNHN